MSSAEEAETSNWLTERFGPVTPRSVERLAAGALCTDEEKSVGEEQGSPLSMNESRNASVVPDGP